ITINGELKIGYVNFSRSVGMCDIEEYDIEWKHTMKAEEGVMQSRPTDIRLN
ncbi:hypothetical protein LCGC14_2296810, partial [marine sediment metagenome]